MKMATIVKPESKREVYIQLWQYRSSALPSEYGFSLHFLKKDWEAFVKNFWANKPDDAPATYECQFGRPFLCEVDQEMFLRVKKEENIRLYKDFPVGIPKNFLNSDAWAKTKYSCPE
jgi:hypothetical protein